MNSSINQINQILAEEGAEFGFSYDFDQLRDRFVDGYEESIEEGDEWVTIKIPSGVETAFKTTTIGKALAV